MALKYKCYPHTHSSRVSLFEVVKHFNSVILPNDIITKLLIVMEEENGGMWPPIEDQVIGVPVLLPFTSKHDTNDFEPPWPTTQRKDHKEEKKLYYRPPKPKIIKPPEVIPVLKERVEKVLVERSVSTEHQIYETRQYTFSESRESISMIINQHNNYGLNEKMLKWLVREFIKINPAVLPPRSGQQVEIPVLHTSFLAKKSK
jgi:hypothetical protein